MQLVRPEHWPGIVPTTPVLRSSSPGSARTPRVLSKRSDQPPDRIQRPTSGPLAHSHVRVPAERAMLPNLNQGALDTPSVPSKERDVHDETPDRSAPRPITAPIRTPAAFPTFGS